MGIKLNNRVAIVTGAGSGLGREHALLLSRLGARVVVNDLGSDIAGNGGSSDAANRVVAEIRAAGGEAIANGASVTNAEHVKAMVQDAMAQWGRVDILVNNAGILRDKSFSKMEEADFRAVLDVHLMGAFHCCKAVWDIMKAQNHGRIIMTTSSSGLFGNFGQANYSAAKMALVGLMQTLAIEGQKNNIKVNCLAPSAATRMLEGLVAKEVSDALTPASVSPAVAVMASDDAPSRMIICAGAGSFEASHITLTPGKFIGVGEGSADRLLENLASVSDRKEEIVPTVGLAQISRELKNAGHTVPEQK